MLFPLPSIVCFILGVVHQVTIVQTDYMRDINSTAGRCYQDRGWIILINMVSGKRYTYECVFWSVSIMSSLILLPGRLSCCIILLEELRCGIEQCYIWSKSLYCQKSTCQSSIKGTRNINSLTYLQLDFFEVRDFLHSGKDDP